MKSKREILDSFSNTHVISKDDAEIAIDIYYNQFTWNDVKDNLPPETTAVILWVDSKDNEYDKKGYHYKGIWKDMYDNVIDGKVTHWMYESIKPKK